MQIWKMLELWGFGEFITASSPLLRQTDSLFQQIGRLKVSWSDRGPDSRAMHEITVNYFWINKRMSLAQISRKFSIRVIDDVRFIASKW